MEVDSPPTNNSSSNNNNKASKTGIERMIELGRELLQMSMRLEKKYANVNDEIVTQNRKMMEVSVLRKLNLVNYLSFSLCFRKHSVYSLTQIRGPVPSESSSLPQNVSQFAQNSIRLF